MYAKNEVFVTADQAFIEDLAASGVKRHAGVVWIPKGLESDEQVAFAEVAAHSVKVQSSTAGPFAMRGTVLYPSQTGLSYSTVMRTTSSSVGRECVPGRASTVGNFREPCNTASAFAARACPVPERAQCLTVCVAFVFAGPLHGPSWDSNTLRVPAVPRPACPIGLLYGHSY
jgi:hypothetical protein